MISLSEMLLFINKLSSQLGGSYLSNDDLIIDLEHQFPIQKLLLLKKNWNLTSLQKIISINEYIKIYHDLWSFESIPSYQQIKNIILKINEQIDLDKIDFILLGHESLIWLVPLLKSDYGVKVGIITHGTPTHCLEKLGKRFSDFYFTNFQQADFVISVATHLANIISSCINKPIFIVPNLPKLPLKESKRKTNIISNEVNILQISTLRKIKRPLDSLVLLDHLKKKGFSCFLTIIGNGPLLHSLKQLSNSRDNIKLISLATRDEIYEILCKNDFLFLPSSKEGLSRVVIEALQSKLIPIISTGANGSNLIIDGMNGVLFRTGDIVTASLKIINLCNKLEQRLKIYTNGKKTVRELHLERNKALEDLIYFINSFKGEISNGRISNSKEKYNLIKTNN